MMYFAFKIVFSFLCFSCQMLTSRAFLSGRSSMLHRPSILNNIISLSAASTLKPSQEVSKQTINRSYMLHQVQQIMKDRSLDAIVVPTDDPHMSEYTAEYFNRREFISGFTGSAGVAVITTDNAYLFTDGRYHNQADLELSPEWTLMRSGLKDVPTPLDFLASHVQKNGKVGIDPFVHPAETVKKMTDKFKAKDIKVEFIQDAHPVDMVWSVQRPLPPQQPLRIHPLTYAGQSTVQKLSEIRSQMSKNNAEALVLTSLDEIMWLFNVRGGDVFCNPVAVSYAIVTIDKAYFFIDDVKVSNPELTVYFAEQRITIKPYDHVLPTLHTLLDSNTKQTSATLTGVWVDPKSINAAIYNAIPAAQRVEKESPVVLLKACKNTAELDGMRACHLRDGASVVEFLAHLEHKFYTENAQVSEVEIDEILTSTRAACPLFIEPSFPTIAGCNGNGAIVHYRAVKETCKMVSKNDMLLLDSGGQYVDGTTDVTRTFHFGTPSAHQKNMYTRVLKGHIALDRMIFPSGTSGCMLDSFARQHLWRGGKDYNHGTGHGVGAALNVHERPQRISPVLFEQGLLPGMVISNEPGYYETGSFGIRIENLMIVSERPELGTFNGKAFLGFEKLTHIPIQKKLIEIGLLDAEEKAWLNEYHEQVKHKLAPLLRTELAGKWLQDVTAPL